MYVQMCVQALMQDWKVQTFRLPGSLEQEWTRFLMPQPTWF